MFAKRRPILATMAAGAVAGPLIVLRDALFSSETDWSGNWWIVAGLLAAVVGAAMGAALGAGAGALWTRVQARARP